MPKNPAAARTALFRAAGDIIGSERLSRALGVSARTGYKMMAGTAHVRTATLAATRRLLVDHRQRVGMLIALIRAEEAGEPRDEDR